MEETAPPQLAQPSPFAYSRSESRQDDSRRSRDDSPTYSDIPGMFIRPANYFSSNVGVSHPAYLALLQVVNNLLF